MCCEIFSSDWGAGGIQIHSFKTRLKYVKTNNEAGLVTQLAIRYLQGTSGEVLLPSI